MEKHYSVIAYSQDTKQSFNVINTGNQSYLSTDINQENTYSLSHGIIALYQSLCHYLDNNHIINIQSFDNNHNKVWFCKDNPRGEFYPASQRKFKDKYPYGFVFGLAWNALRGYPKETIASQHLFRFLHNNFNKFKKYSSNCCLGAYFPDDKQIIAIDPNINQDRLNFVEDYHLIDQSSITNFDSAFKNLVSMIDHKIAGSSTWTYTPKYKSTSKNKAISEIAQKKFNIVIVKDLKMLGMINAKIRVDQDMLKISNLIENIYAQCSYQQSNQ